MFRLLLSIILLCSFLCNKAFSGSGIRIIQISDVQLGFTEARLKETGKAVEFGLDEKYFALAVESINKLNPEADVVINTGDIVNDPSSSMAWENYKNLSMRLKPEIYEVMGNHDGWNAQGVDEFKKRFGHNDYYTFTVKNCRFIALNSWYLKEPGKNPKNAEEQKHFLEHVLQKDKSAFRIIMLHFPLYIESSDENDAYFNLPLKEREWLLDLAVKYKVKLILSGHSHRNIVKTYRDSVTLITTGPISEPLGSNDDKTASERGFRIIDINLSTGTFTHEFVGLPGLEVKTENNAFSFVFLGDLHFDKPDHHDMQWVIKTHPSDTSQIRQYCERTKRTLPALFEDIRDISDKNASFIVQSGDFTEGLCGNFSLSALQLTEFIHFTGNNTHIPFLLSKGNHDITGPGADSAYKSVIYPFLSRQTGQQVNDSKFVFVKDQSVFFFYDSYDKSSLAWLGGEMYKYRDYPCKFVIMHEPVIPINARSKWTEFSSPEETGNHERLLELLGDNRAIVLAGHLHTYGLVVRKTTHGKFVQVSCSSVLDSLFDKPGRFISGINLYGPSLVDLEPGFSPADRDERAARLSAEKPYILFFEEGDIRGYVVIKVSNKSITAEIYTGTGCNKWKTVDITRLLTTQGDFQNVQEVSEYHQR